MGVVGSTQRLRPMVNPDGKVGLKISRRLIEKLDGIEGGGVVSTSTRNNSSSGIAGAGAETSGGGSGETSGGGSGAGAGRGILALPSDAAILADARSAFPGLDSALGRSRRVGELLLKNEAEELARVQQWASEIAAAAYAIHPREVPCGAERDACRGCYEANAAEPLKCAGEVAAYEKCARVAQKAFVAGTR